MSLSGVRFAPLLTQTDACCGGNPHKEHSCLQEGHRRKDHCSCLKHLAFFGVLKSGADKDDGEHDEQPSRDLPQGEKHCLVPCSLMSPA